MLAQFVDRINLSSDTTACWISAGTHNDRKVVFLGMEGLDGERLEIAIEPGDAVLLANRLKNLVLGHTKVFLEDPDF